MPSTRELAAALRQFADVLDSQSFDTVKAHIVFSHLDGREKASFIDLARSHKDASKSVTAGQYLRLTLLDTSALCVLSTIPADAFNELVTRPTYNLPDFIASMPERA